MVSTLPAGSPCKRSPSSVWQGDCVAVCTLITGPSWGCAAYSRLLVAEVQSAQIQMTMELFDTRVRKLDFFSGKKIHFIETVQQIKMFTWN